MTSWPPRSSRMATRARSSCANRYARFVAASLADHDRVSLVVEQDADRALAVERVDAALDAVGVGKRACQNALDVQDDLAEGVGVPVNALAIRQALCHLGRGLPELGGGRDARLRGDLRHGGLPGLDRGRGEVGQVDDERRAADERDRDRHHDVAHLRALAGPHGPHDPPDDERKRQQRQVAVARIEGELAQPERRRERKVANRARALPGRLEQPHDAVAVDRRDVGPAHADAVAAPRVVHDLAGTRLAEEVVHANEREALLVI